MKNKQKFDASDVTWNDPEHNDPWAMHAILYEDVISPQGFRRLNPFAWIRYWRKRKNNLIAHVNLNGESDDVTIDKDGTVHITNKHTIE